MRAFAAAALSLSLLPAAGCINLDLGNGEANVFEAEVDATNINGFLGFIGAKRNIKFGKIVTLDPGTDETRLGAVATDTIGGDPITIEFSYWRDNVIKLEDLLDAGNQDPRGALDSQTTFMVADPQLQPFSMGFFVTFTRKKKIVNDNGNVRNQLVTESFPAYCNFIDPIDATAKGCFAFSADANDNDTGNTIGAIAGVGGENTSVATFQDLIVIDPDVYDEAVEDLLEENKNPTDINDPDVVAELSKSILIRIARNKPGNIKIFNANLAVDAE